MMDYHIIVKLCDRFCLYQHVLFLNADVSSGARAKFCIDPSLVQKSLYATAKAIVRLR